MPSKVEHFKHKTALSEASFGKAVAHSLNTLSTHTVAAFASVSTKKRKEYV